MAKSPEMVRVRIKRFGTQWATCGVGVRPPERLVGEPRMKRLCPKLVPGQIIELPATHSLLKQTKLIEIVQEPEADEFIRPWVFNSAEDAMLANPNKSRLGPEQIMTGLALSDGAISNQQRRLDERQDAREAEEFDRPGTRKTFNEDHPEPDYEDDEDELEDEATVARRAGNRVSRKVKDEAVPVEDDEDEPRRAPAAKTSRAGRAKARDKDEAPRRRRRTTSD